MTKIEQEMNRAIEQGRNWKCKNTEVVVNGDIAEVYLYGRLIAQLDDSSIQLWDSGYQTATTKSRINAILEANGTGDERIYQRDHQWRICFDGIDEPFQNGVIL